MAQARGASSWWRLPMARRRALTTRGRARTPRWRRACIARWCTSHWPVNARSEYKRVLEYASRYGMRECSARRVWVPARTLANPIARSVLEYPFVLPAGHLTVSGYTHMQYRNLFIPNDVGLQRCLSIAWITVQKQASASLPAAWLPPAQNAWWQKELPQKSAVGLLVLN